MKLLIDSDRAKVPKNCNECLLNIGGSCPIAPSEENGDCIDRGKPDWCPIRAYEELIQCNKCIHATMTAASYPHWWCDLANRYKSADGFCDEAREPEPNVTKGGAARMSKEKEYRLLQTKTAKLKDVIALIRSRSYSYSDEDGTTIVICPECEEWTHVRFNANSGLLDLLGELTVSSIDAGDNDRELRLWLETDDFNWFNVT
jgi:hypothetical protein